MAVNTEVKRQEKFNEEEKITKSRVRESLSGRPGEDGAEQHGVLSLCPFLNSKVGAGFLLISSLFVNYPPSGLKTRPFPFVAFCSPSSRETLVYGSCCLGELCYELACCCLVTWKAAEERGR